MNLTERTIYVEIRVWGIYAFMKCPYCGSERIEIGISWGKTADVGNIGLKYKEGVFVGVVQVYSDLCMDCKNILRTYIKDDTNKNWNHNPGNI